MKICITIVVALTVASTFCNAAASGPVVVMSKNVLMEEVTAFKSWMVQHKKSYANIEEEEQRLMNFVQNYQAAKEHNGQSHSWKKELNAFSDMSFKEFSRLYLMQSQNCSATDRNGHQLSGEAPPEHKDWREEGKFVTPVKNQGECGSCWTFSTTGCMESATAIHSSDHKLYTFSEQQLIDCAQAFDDHGCNGGLPSHAFEYIHYNKGLMTEKDYPYKAVGGDCKFKPADATGFVKSVVNITMGSETEIKDAVAFQNPVSVAFEVIAGFKDYKTGVYSSKLCGTSPDQVNHAVLAVGYGVDANTGMKYWIIKNSWGPDWGMNGYFLMERDVNMCGVSTCASYPVV
ncbi:pro-cathepsin H-like [Clavelina lepadiformis]|uniref:Uncharacterized protein n=1 Tax=Clavelina lepadiformis TaxID=159417 RepID=A0ABP0GS79_CLALP